MSRNLWTFLSFAFHCLKRFLELFLAEFSVLNNGIWSLEKEDLDTPELAETLTPGERMTMVHRLSVLFRARFSIFHSSWWLLPGSALGCCLLLGPHCNASPNPCTWIMSRESQDGEKAGKRADGPLLLVPIWVWEIARVYTSLRSSKAQKWFSK